jgi:hypothetical protein
MSPPRYHRDATGETIEARAQQDSAMHATQRQRLDELWTIFLGAALNFRELANQLARGCAVKRANVIGATDQRTTSGPADFILRAKRPKT